MWIFAKFRNAENRSSIPKIGVDFAKNGSIFNYLLLECSIHFKSIHSSIRSLVAAEHDTHLDHGKTPFETEDGKRSRQSHVHGTDGGSFLRAASVLLEAAAEDRICFAR